MTVHHQQQQRLAYSALEASRLLGISRDFLYELIRRGELRSVRLGHKVLIPADEMRRVSGTSSAA